VETGGEIGAMVLFEFVIAGPPLSHQTRTRANLRAWSAAVRLEASRRWPVERPPLTGPLQITVVYFHEGVAVAIDNDNMVKPIQDALIGLIYQDDRQITDTRVRKAPIDQPFRARRMSRVLAEGFIQGDEFLYVRIEDAPSHEEFL
jgi:crossover junction endodeoxyribonuclease RusA